MKKLAVLSRMYLQLQQANVIQTMQMVEAFSGIIPTTLIANKTRHDYKRDAKSPQEILESFGISPAIEFIHYHNPFYFLPGAEEMRRGYLQRLGLAYLEKNNFDYLFTREESFACEGCKICPTVLELHDIKNVHDFQTLQKCLDAYPLKVVAISEGLRNQLLRQGVDENYITVLHDGVNLGRFQNDALEPLFESERKVLGYAGHLYADRGVDLILETARQYPQLDCYLAGGFPEDVEKFQRRSNESGLENIHFLGMLPYRDIPAFLKSCDYLIMPYSAKLNTIESCSPLKLFEYMASGKVVISSNIPTVLEVLNEENGLLFRADDPTDLLQIMERLLNGKVDEKRLCANALRDVAPYSWQARGRAIINMFEKLEKSFI